MKKTIVNFYKINEKEIIYYVENYKPYDKSGAYGIQDYSMIFVKNIEGCFNNVIGFPISKFYKLCSMNSTIYKIIESNKMAKEQEEKYFFNDFKDNRKSLNLTVDDIVKSTKIQSAIHHCY